MAISARRSPTKRVGAALLIFFGTFLLWMAGCHTAPSGSAAQPVTVTVVGWGPDTLLGLQTAKAVVAEFSRKTGIQVNYIAGPENTSDRPQLYLQWLEKKSKTPDLFYTDVIWQGPLAEHMVDLNPYLQQEAAQIWPAAIQNDTIGGKLVAMPYNLEIGVLYYRADLLKKYGYKHPPETWDELAKMAAKIQTGERAAGNPDFWGFVWQGALYEGLTCDALEWQASYGGGKIIEDNGVISVNNPQTVNAMKMAKSWIGTISPPGVLAFMEEDSRNLWDAGNAAFRRDWVWKEPTIGKLPNSPAEETVEVALLPSGGAGPASVFGGESLAVSKYSDHPREAIELIRYLTSRDVQLELWRRESMLPTIREFYDDPKYLATRPDLQRLKGLFAGGAITRPSTVTGKRYAEVSKAYYSAVHSVLAGDVSAEKGMADLEKELVKITGLPTGRPGAAPRSVVVH